MSYKNLEHAVSVSIEVWTKLAELGCCKYELPHSIFDKIEDDACNCPLCDYFIEKYKNDFHLYTCERYCPLEGCMNGAWCHWADSYTEQSKKKYAQQIVDKLEEWVWYGTIYTDYTETEMREG